jgi:hypothetical protein
MIPKVGYGLMAALIALAGTGVGIYRYRQYREQQYEQRREQQLSPEVKAAVVAVIGQNANLSDADVVAFLRAAKLGSRTRRDNEIVGLLDKWISTVKQMAEDKRQAASFRQLILHSRRWSGAWVKEDEKVWDRRARTFEESGQREEQEADELIKKLWAIPELQAAK